MTNGENAVLDRRALIGITTLVAGATADGARAPASSHDEHHRARAESFGLAQADDIRATP